MSGPIIRWPNWPDLLPLRRLLARRLLVPSLALLVAALLVAFSQSSAQAQPTEEQLKQLTPEQRAQYEKHMKRRGARPATSTPVVVNQPNEKSKKEKPKDDKGKEEKKPEEPKTVKRPTEPTTPPNPEELKVAPDESGRVQFSFRGQPWKDVLQWYADVAGYSFDWQELPDGFVNITTQRKYTLPETRDLLNRHLLSRGFTMLLQGEVLTAVKISQLDASLVPRLEADDLEDYLPHDFGRVRFQLPLEIDPTKVAEDAKVLLSPHAKVLPLLATRRLLVIDAVANLRDVRDLLYAEQSAASQVIKPKVYQIHHRRADYVADQILVVLGMDPESRQSPQELQVEQQRMQMFQQMQKKGQDVSKLLNKGDPKVFIAVNQRGNSLLINAPPELIPTIERTITELDQPDGSEGGLASGALTMMKYKTVTASPDAIITALNDIAHLDPRSQLYSDAGSKTIYANATPADHDKIGRMIDKLDGSGRRFEVIWLRRLAADQVAGTIMTFLVGDKKKEEDSSSMRYFFGRSRGSNDKPKEVGFSAQADIENNRLVLWANDAELEEVHKLLVQLGELPSDQSRNPHKVRIIQAGDPAETARLLKQLDAAWSGKNRLQIHSSPDKPDSKPETTKPQPTAKPASRDTVTLRALPPSSDHSSLKQTIRLVALETEGSDGDSPPEQPAEKPSDDGEAPPAEQPAEPDAPPIDVIVTDDGRIVMRSDDPLALDELEDLLSELTPPQDEFAVFHLHNSTAGFVVLNLEEYFEEELKGQQEGVYTPWGDYRGSKDKNTGPTSLSKRRLLRFIYDFDTNTIVVQNASPAQLRIITQLIEIYDRPVGADSAATRRTEAIKIRYSQATDIATALKEVYRDLLSSKDKEFQGKDGQGKARNETYYRFYSGPPEDGNKKPSAVKVAFEGALSIGVDEISNTLIISAQEDVWDSVRQIVQSLDEAAKPNTVVHVHEISGMISSTKLQKTLAAAMGQPWPGGKPAKKAAAKGGEGKEKKQDQDNKNNNDNK